MTFDAPRTHPGEGTIEKRRFQAKRIIYIFADAAFNSASARRMAAI
jgi:hypothetical protein